MGADSNSVVLNGGHAPFVEDEFDAGEDAVIKPGHALELDANADVVRHTQETDLNQRGPATGMFAELPFDPAKEKPDTFALDERVPVVYCPVGGKVDALLAAGGDLGDGSRANVDPTTPVEAVAGGVLAEHDGTATTGDGTGGATETVYDEGALYLPLESVDNSGAAAGETARVEVVRIA